MKNKAEDSKDTIQDYFKSRGYIPGGIITNSRKEDIDMETLAPFLRTLLVTDGTVTKSLEAFFWEFVGVETIDQAQTESPEDIDWLEVKKGNQVLHRQVRLVGRHTGSIFAYADSILKLDHLPTGVQKDLLDGKIGIGELLRECGLETYREVMDMGRAVNESLAKHFNKTHCGELAYRTYRIVINHHPTILITEYFPCRLYAKP